MTETRRETEKERWQYLEKRSQIAQMTEFSVVMASTSIHKLGTCTLFGVASYKLENKMSFSLYASMGAGHIYVHVATILIFRSVIKVSYTVCTQNILHERIKAKSAVLFFHEVS